MPSVPKIRKAKRVTVLTKRSLCMKKYYTERSRKPIYEKLKKNNSYLAKALSQEKQNNQALFTQNLSLVAEVQNLNLAYNKRNGAIENILNNTKEMLKLIVNISGYAANIISVCQELTSDTTTRVLSASIGRKELTKRLSKSPAKGVVKPMVSGHTITKPTINLSRVNMENINNASRLSDISEVSESTPNNSQEINEERVSVIVPLPSTPVRYENGRACRMPERLNVSSPRVSLTNEQTKMRRKKGRHSKKMSESYSRSRSNRWSMDETPRNSTGHIIIGSPTVKLKDVSKLLKDAQTINVRRLINRKPNEDIEVSNIKESNDDAPHDTPKNAMIPEIRISIDSEPNEMYARTTKKEANAQSSSKMSDQNFGRNTSVIDISRLQQNNTRTWEEDPLEGPSWLFNNTLAMPSRDNEPDELDQLNVSDVNNNTSQVYESNNAENSTEESPPLSSLIGSTNNSQTVKRDASSVADRTKCESYLNDDNDVDDSFYGARTVSNRRKNLDNTEDSDEDITTNFRSFVTVGRGHSTHMEEQTEDFTLLLRQTKRNMQFDINELRLPEESMMNSTTGNGVDTEITTATMNIPMSTVNLNDSTCSNLRDQLTVKLPLILINNHEKITTTTPENKKHSNKKNSKTRTLKDVTNDAENSLTIKSPAKPKNGTESNRDPSAAKVVLEKLNSKSHIKARISPCDDMESGSANTSQVSTMSQEDNSRDSENSHSSTRLRRRKAPTSLKEPSLQKKLRRN